MCAEVESSTCQGRAAGGAASNGRNVQDEIRAKCVLEFNLYLAAAHDLTVQEVPPDGDSIASWWAGHQSTDLSQASQPCRSLPTPRRALPNLTCLFTPTPFTHTDVTCHLPEISLI